MTHTKWHIAPKQTHWPLTPNTYLHKIFTRKRTTIQIHNDKKASDRATLRMWLGYDAGDFPKRPALRWIENKRGSRCLRLRFRWLRLTATSGTFHTPFYVLQPHFEADIVLHPAPHLHKGRGETECDLWRTDRKYQRRAVLGSDRNTNNLPHNPRKFWYF